MDPDDSKTSGRWVALAIIVAGAALLRFWRLGEASFWIDEYFHVVAAENWLARGEPLLADGRAYVRALPQTWLVRASFEMLGVSEFTARLPSALLGLILVAGTYVVGRRRLGDRAALLGSALVATSPVLVSTSRLCRMYALLALLQLVAFHTYNRAFEDSTATLRRRILWATATLGLVAITYRYVHLLALHLPAAVFAYWLCRAIAAPRSRYGAYVMVAFGTAALAWSVGAVDPANLWRKARQWPLWVEAPVHGVGYYAGWWAEAYPWLWWLTPAALFVLVREKGWWGVLLALQVAVPLVLHSVVMPFKQLRYVADVFPYLALSLAPLGVLLVDVAHRTARNALARVQHWPRLPRVLAMVAIAQGTGAALAVVFAPSLQMSLRLTDRDQHPRWREAFAHVASRAHEGDVVISVVPYASEFYLRHLGWHLRPLGATAELDQGLYWMTPWDPSQHLETLHARVANYGQAWFIADEARFSRPAIVPAEVTDWLERAAIRHSSPSAPEMRIYQWDAAKLRKTLE